MCSQRSFSKIESNFHWLSWQNVSTATENYKFTEIFRSFTADIMLEISHQMIIAIRIHEGYLFENVSSIVFIHSYTEFSYSFGCAVIWSRIPRSFKTSLNWSKATFRLVNFGQKTLFVCLHDGHLIICLNQKLQPRPHYGLLRHALRPSCSPDAQKQS